MKGGVLGLVTSKCGLECWSLEEGEDTFVSSVFCSGIAASAVAESCKVCPCMQLESVRNVRMFNMWLFH